MAVGVGTRSLSRVDQVWLALPYALLVVAAALTWASGDLTTGEPQRVLLASGLVAAWHTWWTVLHPGWLEIRLVPMAVYYVGLVGLTAYLFHLTFNFFPLYLVCYAMAFVALPGHWAYAGVALTTAVALLGPRLLTWSVENVVVTLAGAVLAAVAGGSIRALEAETARRRTVLAALARTHADLERALAANLDLTERLVVEAREAGVTAERARLAGELHDTLAAGLAGILSQLEALDAELGPGSPLRARVQASLATARDSLGEARRSVRALRPGALTRGTLVTAVRETATHFTETAGVPVEVLVTGRETTLPPACEDVLVRAAHEALTNVARHAGATRVHLTVSYLGDAVALDVADDGTGSSGYGPGSGSGGHGLAIMAERVTALGGRVDVDGAPGRGTTLTVTVPGLPRDGSGPL